jgi:hypothetical protein
LLASYRPTNAHRVATRFSVAIELEENEARLDLETADKSRARLAELRAEQAAAEAEASAISGAARARKRRHDQPTGNARGRPKGRTAGSQRDLAARTGESMAEQERRERHVALVDRRVGWGTIGAQSAFPAPVAAC